MRNRRFVHSALALTMALGAVGAAHLAAQSTDLYNNTNAYGVGNNPAGTTAFFLSGYAQVTQIVTYHWNNGRGATPGSITLRSATGLTYGPFRAHGTAGQGNAQNVNWIADVNISLPGGNFIVIDSDPATWAQNAQSAYRGFVIVRGVYTSRVTSPVSPVTSVYRPPVTPAVPAIPPACHGTSGADVELARPDCIGSTGTVLRFVVLRQLAAPLTGVVFRPGPIGAQYGLRRPPATMAVEVLAGGGGLALVSGNGASAGSVYQVVAPRSLCMAGPGQWTWDIYERRGGGLLQGDVDDFTISGC